MRILFLNNFFYERGGAEKSMFDTADVLGNGPNSVYFMSCRHRDNMPYRYDRHFVSDSDFKTTSAREALKLLGGIYRNFEAERKISALLDEIGGVDIAHLNNIMYRLGPSVIRYFNRKGIPVVFHLRDYNVVCGAVSMTANGRPCDACRDGRFSSVLSKRCKGGLAGSLVIYTTMVFYHRIMRYFDGVDTFISPSRFLRDKHVEMGFKGNIVVLPNFIYAERLKPAYGSVNGAYVFFGRLSREKGIGTLLNVCARLPRLRFKIIGTGPLEDECRRFIAEKGLRNVEMKGYIKGEGLYDEIRGAKAVVVPSEWYENNSKAILEAMALGKPVVASRIGGNPELVRDGETGYLFAPFSEDDLAEKLARLDRDGGFEEMGRRARAVIESDFNPQAYLRGLMEIYGDAIGRALRRRQGRS
jgi:glycosyltransferase involved in cell wall biosynthesis